MTSQDSTSVYSVNIAILAGGTPAQLAAEHEIIPAEIRLRLDVLAELSKFEVRELKSRRLFQMPLGADVSFADLTTMAPTSVAAALRTKPAFNTKLGGGQNRPLGEILAQCSLKVSAFETFYIREFFPAISQACGGRFESIRIWGIGGKAGAIGSGALLPVAAYVADRLVCETGASVDLQLVTFGSLAWLGLGVNLLKNTGAAQLDFVDFVRATPARPNVHRSHHMLEIPPCNNDPALRHRLVCESIQALLSSPVDERILGILPNEGRNSPFGNNFLLQIDRCHHLSEADVAADVAEEYSHPLREAISVPADEAAFGAAEFNVVSRPLQRESVDDLIDRAAKMDSEELIARICAPNAEHYVKVILPRPGGKPFCVSSARFGVQQSFSIAGVRDYLQMLRSMQVKLERARVQAADEGTDLMEQVQYAAARVKQLFRNIQQQSVVTRVTGITRQLARLADRADTLRGLSDELLSLQQQRIALEAACKAVSDEEQTLTTQYLELKAAVDGFQSLGNLQERPALVRAKNIDDRLRELLADRHNPTALLAGLRRSVDVVTMAGLARCVGSSSARAEDLWQLLADGKCFVEGPPWGGKVTFNAAAKVIVTPPLDPLDLAALELARAARGDALQLVCADAATVSVNVLRLHYRAAEGVAELFPPTVKSGLSSAVNDPERAMFINNVDAMDRLGLKIDGPEPVKGANHV